MTELPKNDGEWVGLYLEMAEVGVGRCGEALGKPEPDVAEANVACREAAAGLAGVRTFTERMGATLRRQTRAVGAMTVATALLAAVWLCWPPAPPRNATAAGDDRAFRQNKLEEEAVRLMIAGDLRAAQSVVDREMDDGPLVWHLRGELAVLRKDYPGARPWYEKAAAKGFRPSALALLVLDKKLTARPSRTP